ncbi:putative deoxynucleotide monophosphate kinase [Faustovirus]|nr:putative deoxynucleotide monophosphate kinase [Faustovirus]
MYCLYRYFADSQHRAYVASYSSKSIKGADCPDLSATNGGLKLALGYRSRVGKDTAADTILTAYGGHLIRFAEPVYAAATKHTLGITGTAFKHPGLLQITGEMMRSHTYNSPVKIAHRKIREVELYGVFMRYNWGVYTPLAAAVKAAYNKCTGRYIGRNMVVVDMRYADEMEMLTKHGFKTVKITRGDYAQVVDRDTKHISECGLDEHEFDHTWENNGTIEAWKATVIAKCEALIST